MPYCPHCGSEVAADHVYCGSCGEALPFDDADGAGGGTTADGAPDDDRPAHSEDPPDGPAETADSAPAGPAAASAEPTEDPPADGDGQPPAADEPSNPIDDGDAAEGATAQMDAASDVDDNAELFGYPRRTVLTYGGAAAAVVAGGWWVFLRDDGTGPEQAVRQYLNRLDAGDIEGANEMLHDDARIEPLPPGFGDLYEHYDISIDSLEEVDRTGNQATVAVDFSVYDPDTGDTEQQSAEFVVQADNGAWYIYDD